MSVNATHADENVLGMDAYIRATPPSATEVLMVFFESNISGRTKNNLKLHYAISHKG